MGGSCIHAGWGDVPIPDRSCFSGPKFFLDSDVVLGGSRSLDTTTVGLLEEKVPGTDVASVLCFPDVTL